MAVFTKVPYIAMEKRNAPLSPFRRSGCFFFFEAKGQGADDVFAKVCRGNEELVVVKQDAVKGAPLVS